MKLLLLALALSNTLLASNNCAPSNDCDSRSISDDCGDPCLCAKRKSCVHTFFRPRSITSDLTYRNALTFYNKYHEARCSFFTFDSTFLYQQNRHGTCIGTGFLGRNPLLVAEEGGNVNSIHLGLGSLQPGGFKSQVRLSPKRKVAGWLPQFHFNLAYACPGLWTDIAFAVVHANHRICLDEKVTTPSEIEKDRTTVTEAFDKLGVFPDDRKHTGVDDIEVRFGYDYVYCDTDHIGIYLLGRIPTGKEFDNTKWFQPLVGSKHGGIGCGLTLNHRFWENECISSDFVLLSELKYQFLFRHTERRIFDWVNGPLSRFLLVVSDDARYKPFSGLNSLKQCVRVEPRHYVEWWLAAHYQSCLWGFEGAYNLSWRKEERISPRCFDFEGIGIYDLTQCANITSNSRARICDAFGEGTQDKEFVEQLSPDVNLSSGAAGKALSHTFSGTISYNDVFCDCYPCAIAFGARYELANKDERLSTLENWGVFGKVSISF